MDSTGGTTLPVLKIFAISHYCEKARWALDYCKVDYSIELLALGEHIKIARNLGLDDTTLPILVTDEAAIQGSSQIIDWAESNKADAGVHLNPDVDIELCRQMEQRLDRRLGVACNNLTSSALMSAPSSFMMRFFYRK